MLNAALNPSWTDFPSFWGCLILYRVFSFFTFLGTFEIPFLRTDDTEGDNGRNILSFFSQPTNHSIQSIPVVPSNGTHVSIRLRPTVCPLQSVRYHLPPSKKCKSCRSEQIYCKHDFRPVARAWNDHRPTIRPSTQHKKCTTTRHSGDKHNDTVSGNDTPGHGFSFLRYSWARKRKDREKLGK